jgi:hypothetical protein
MKGLACTPLITGLAFAALVGCASETTPTTDSETRADSGANTPPPQASTGDPWSSKAGEALFAASGNATPDTIFGVWSIPSINAGNFRYDTRARFTENTMEMALRCTRSDTSASLIAALSARARVSATEIAVLEATSDHRYNGDFDCEVTLSMITAKVCEEDAPKSNCFVLDGTTLTLYTSELQTEEWTKVSD